MQQSKSMLQSFVACTCYNLPKQSFVDVITRRELKDEPKKLPMSCVLFYLIVRQVLQNTQAKQNK